MSRGVNKFIGIGNLGKDPEVRYSPQGAAVCNFSIAISEQWKDREGQKQERTEWVRLVGFGKLGEIAGEFLKKGSKVYVEGRLQTRKWQGQDGQDRYTTEVVLNEMQMLDGRPAEGGNRPAQQQQPAPAGGDDLSDDIPFGPVPMEAGG